MPEKVVPMFHVPNVRATADWYESIGFTVLARYGDEGDGNSFAMLSFGSGEVMFSSGGQSSTRHRREVDLYVYVDNVDDLYERLKDRVEIVEGLHDAFYGMREFIIRDVNRFWITFGQPSVFARLMEGVVEGDANLVEAALKRGGLKPETLTAALATALLSDNQNSQIQELLKEAGAIAPADVDAETLQTYVGKYADPRGVELNVTLKDGRLCAALGSQQPLTLLALNQTTFIPIAFDNYGTATFSVEAGRTTGCAIKNGESTIHFKRVKESGERSDN
jgi:uncharacterized glyoxalase superfamily protein PhnB